MATNISTRVVTPDYAYGLISGLLAGVVVVVWVTLLSALGHHGDQAAYVASAVKGSDVVQHPTGTDSALGLGIHFAAFALLGLLFAFLWPFIRRRGLLVPALGFWLLAYVVLHQIGFRTLQPEAFRALNEGAIGTGFLLSGIVFIRRYRGR